MAGRFSASYLRVTVRMPCLPSSLLDTSRMKPSSRSTSQMRCFILLAGTSKSARPARWALRIRVNRSAIGSVMLTLPTSSLPYPWARRLSNELPARLDHSGDLALEGAVAEADAAHLELVEEGAIAAADGAALVGADLELRLALRLGNLGELGHSASLLPAHRSAGREKLGGPGGSELTPGGGAGGAGSQKVEVRFHRRFTQVAHSGRPEGHAHVAQERAAFLVVLGGGDDGDVHPFDLLDPVVVDLGEDDLLADAERVVPLPVERLRGDALEIAHAGQRDAHQAVEELVHPGAAQGNHRADRLPFAQLEVGDRLARLGDDRLLAADGHHLFLRLLDELVVGDGLAEAHVDDDLLHLRHLHRVLVAEVLHQLRDDVLLVGVGEARRVLALGSRLPLGGLDGGGRFLFPAALLGLLLAFLLRDDGAFALRVLLVFFVLLVVLLAFALLLFGHGRFLTGRSARRSASRSGRACRCRGAWCRSGWASWIPDRGAPGWRGGCCRSSRRCRLPARRGCGRA